MLRGAADHAEHIAETGEGERLNPDAVLAGIRDLSLKISRLLTAAGQDALRGMTAVFEWAVACVSLSVMAVLAIRTAVTQQVSALSPRRSHLVSAAGNGREYSQPTADKSQVASATLSEWK